MRPWLSGVVAVAGWLVATGAAGAAGGDHEAAQAIVDELGKDAAHQALTAEPVGLARLALERGVRLHFLGDEAHAREADGLAREWAEVARDLVRAADAETKAAEVRRKALDAQVQLERTRALVDEGIARIGRLKAELDEAKKAAGGDAKQDRHAVEAHDGDVKPPKKGTKKAPAKAGTTGGAP
jgi:hypothetical protein